MEEEDVEIIKSNKGGLKVIHKGYMYTVHKRRQCGGIRWRCAQRSLHCKGSISTADPGGGPPKINMPHNHLPDFHSVALARGRQYDEFGDLATMLEMKLDSGDSMPLQERLDKSQSPEKSTLLKSQPLSPTKLKVTRQAKLNSNLNTKKYQSQVEMTPIPPPPPPPLNEEMCLRWNSHHSNMQTAFPRILVKEQYVDVTLAAEGKVLKCHRLILSSCSPYFEEILSGIGPMQHPVLFMKDIPFWILKSLCDFMYAGEVHISQNKLEELLVVAEALKIKGLAGKTTQQPQNKKNDTEELLDPLDLLEPLYEEIQEEKKMPINLKQQQQMKRKRKRKFSEQYNRNNNNVQSPPPSPVFNFRKGTRSRPNVKIPKYYHNDDYNQINVKQQKQYFQQDPLLDLDDIKTEPIDVEDNIICYDENNDNTNGLIETDQNAEINDTCNDNGFIGNNDNSSVECIATTGNDNVIADTKDNSLAVNNDNGFVECNDNGKELSENVDKSDFKKIKLTKPMISNVHTLLPIDGNSEITDIFKIAVIESGIDDNNKNSKEECKMNDNEEDNVVNEMSENVGEILNVEIANNNDVNVEDCLNDVLVQSEISNDNNCVFNECVNENLLQ